MKISGQNILVDLDTEEILSGTLHLQVKSISSQKVFLKIISSYPLLLNLPLNISKSETNILVFLNKLIKNFKQSNITDILGKLIPPEEFPSSENNIKDNLQILKNIISTPNLEKTLLTLLPQKEAQSGFDILWLQNVLNLLQLAKGSAVLYLQVPFWDRGELQGNEVKILSFRKKEENKDNIKFSLFLDLKIIGLILIDLLLYRHKIIGTVNIENEKYENHIRENLINLSVLFKNIGYTSQINCTVDKNLSQKKRKFSPLINMKKVDVRV